MTEQFEDRFAEFDARLSIAERNLRESQRSLSAVSLSYLTIGVGGDLELTASAHRDIDRRRERLEKAEAALAAIRGEAREYCRERNAAERRARMTAGEAAELRERNAG